MVVANNRKDSYLQGRRSLYEAVLLLEREGAIVMDRDLGYADLCLSPMTCLCMWTEQSFQVNFFAALTGQLMQNLFKDLIRHGHAPGVWQGPNTQMMSRAQRLDSIPVKMLCRADGRWLLPDS